MPGNPPEPTPKNNNNTPKVETVDKSNAEEDKNENKETIQDKEGLEFQVHSPSTAEQHVWEASGRHGLRPRWHPSFERRYPRNHYTKLMFHVFTQLNLKQGPKRFGSEGMRAIKS